MVDNIIKGLVWMSTSIVKIVGADTLLQYCKWIKDERSTRQLVCECIGVHDVDLARSEGLSDSIFIEKYNIAPSHCQRLCSILGFQKQAKYPRNKLKERRRG